MCAFNMTVFYFLTLHYVTSINPLSSKHEWNIKKRYFVYLQVILRWLIQRNIIIIPKSTNASRLQQNLQVHAYIVMPYVGWGAYCQCIWA